MHLYSKHNHVLIDFVCVILLEILWYLKHLKVRIKILRFEVCHGYVFSNYDSKNKFNDNYSEITTFILLKNNIYCINLGE